MLVQKKNIVKKCYFQNNKDIQLLRRFQRTQKLLTATIQKSKRQHYNRISTKLMDPTSSPKAYWSILKTFLSITKYLVFHQFFIITIIREKLRSSTKSTNKNASKLLINSFKRTYNLFPTISFTKNDIAKIARNFNPNKAHGLDMISIRMLKICGDSALNL